MRCPDISELPPPPAGESGWPWTEQSARLPETMPDGTPWPRISIVTPSFNQGRFIEETIRSALLQGYPNLEYIVIDGGSTDSTVAVLEKYSPWLSYRVSEPDRGQSHAINKGMAKATGEIAAWLNSDDWLEPDILSAVAAAFRQLPEGMVGLTGACRWRREDNVSEIRHPRSIFYPRLGRQIQYGLQQPSTYFRKAAFDRVGGVDQKIHFMMDKDLWLRFQQQGWDFQPTEKVLSNFRCHEGSKTTGKKPRINLTVARESFRLRNKFLGSPLRPAYWIQLAGSLAELAQSYRLALWEKLNRKGDTR